jgi:hypothetical protein
MQPQIDPMMLNNANRALVINNSVKMTQPIYSGSIDTAAQQVLNVPVRNVGLILGFLVEVSGTVLNTGAGALDRTGVGSSALVKNFTFSDLDNVQRINTTGPLMAVLNSARQGFGFGGAYAPNLPMGYGNNWGPFAAPATVAAGANTANLKHTYYVPLAYSSSDLRGSIYAAIVNATMNLQITLQDAPCAAGGADGLDKVFTGNAAADWSTPLKVTVYQVYLDQLPTSGGVPILPQIDLTEIYDLKYSVYTGMAAGQDFPIDYANFRRFLSTTMIYDNGGAFNAGDDINTIALTAANSTNLWKVSPDIAALLARQTFMADPPKGWYYFDSRDKPVNTVSFGNMQLVVNPITVGANSKIVVGYEAFNRTGNIGVQGSLN